MKEDDKEIQDMLRKEIDPSIYVVDGEVFLQGMYSFYDLMEIARIINLFQQEY